MSQALANIIALGQERVERVKEFQGQASHPFFDWVMRQQKVTSDDFGLRIAVYLAEPGGFTAFNYASAPDFREAISPEDDAMRVYPARSAQPVLMNGDMLRGLKANRENWWIRYQEMIDRYATIAKKNLSRYFHGDGTGALAISNSAIGSTGVATLNGLTSTSGTSGQAKTKGTALLQKNEIYNAINPSTGAVRGTFVVLTEGRASCSINVTSGTIAVNDPIVISGTYNKVPTGIRHLANFSNRVLQNFDTTNAPNLNTPYYDANGNAITPSAFSLAKGKVQTYMNDTEAEKGKIIVMTPGHQKTLVNQAFQYREYTDPKGNETVYGVFSKYVDMDGDIHFIDADAADEQIRILDANSYKVLEDMPWGVYNDDGNEWRMRHGANNSGSDRFFMAIGWQGNLYKSGVAFADAVIDDVAHSGSDYITQAS